MSKASWAFGWVALSGWMTTALISICSDNERDTDAAKVVCSVSLYHPVSLKAKARSASFMASMKEAGSRLYREYRTDSA
jgi:hypothetical protein